MFELIAFIVGIAIFAASQVAGAINQETGQARNLADLQRFYGPKGIDVLDFRYIDNPKFDPTAIKRGTKDYPDDRNQPYLLLDPSLDFTRYDEHQFGQTALAVAHANVTQNETAPTNNQGNAEKLVFAALVGLLLV